MERSAGINRPNRDGQSHQVRMRGRLQTDQAQSGTHISFIFPPGVASQVSFDMTVDSGKNVDPLGRNADGLRLQNAVFKNYAPREYCRALFLLSGKQDF